jgi:hypothetical protein
MPRTTTGHEYRLRERDDPAVCIVCGENDGDPGLNVLMHIEPVEPDHHYAFPVCSLMCVLAWTELIGRCTDGDPQAMAIALAYMAVHDRA